MQTRLSWTLVLFLCVWVALGAGCASSTPRKTLVYFPPAPALARVVHLKSFNTLSEIIAPKISFADMIRGKVFSPYVGTPAGIAWQAGHLYICDTQLNVVHDWDFNTGNARRIGASGDTTLVKPVAVAVDSDGVIYVADTGRSDVIAFDAAGRFVRRYRAPEKQMQYRPVAVATGDHTLYVADIAEHKIDMFSTADGKHLGAFGEVGSKPGQLYYPMGIAIKPNGEVLVSDMMNARVEVFDPAHKMVLTFGQPGDRYGDMGKPKHLAVGPDGVMFIADAEFGTVQLFNAQGQLLMMVGEPEDKPGGTPLPIGVAVASALPERLSSIVPNNFAAKYFFFVTNSIGSHRISLFAIGKGIKNKTGSDRSEAGY